MGYFGSVLLLIIASVILTPAERNFTPGFVLPLQVSGGLDLVTLRSVSYLEEKNLR